MTSTTLEAKDCPENAQEASSAQLDAQSLRLWKNGSLEGYNQLVERYQRPLLHFIYRVIGDRDESRDILQETFVRLYRSLSKLQEDKNLKAWLYQTANNLCIDHLRKHKPGRVKAVDMQEPVTLNMIESQYKAQGGQAQPDQLAQQSHIQERVLKAIEALPKKQRLMMTLRSCEELSLKEIAQVVGCSEKTVGTTLFAARQKLEKMLRPLLPDLFEESR